MEDFLAWLGDNGWLGWVALALVLGTAETLSLDFVFLMLAGGALAGAVASLVGAPVLVAALVAIAFSAALIGVVRPLAQRRLQQPVGTRMGIAALVGTRAVVLEQVDSRGGRIKLAGEVWSARSYDEREVIAVGASVDVIEIEGATALVMGAEGV